MAVLHSFFTDFTSRIVSSGWDIPFIGKKIRRRTDVIMGLEALLLANTAAVFVFPIMATNLYSINVLNNLSGIRKAITASGIVFTSFTLLNLAIISTHKSEYLKEKASRFTARTDSNATELTKHFGKTYKDSGLDGDLIDPEGRHEFWDTDWRRYGVPATLVACLMSVPFMISGTKYVVNLWLSRSYIESPIVTVLSAALLGVVAACDLAEVGSLLYRE